MDTQEQESVDSIYDDIASALDNDNASDETEETEDTTEDVAEDADAVETEETEEPEEDQTEDPPLEAPAHWAQADREVFDGLDRKGQEFLLKRHKDMEADYTRKTKEVAEIRKRGEKLDQLLSPYRNEFSIAGLDDTAAIGRLLAVHEGLRSDPQRTLVALARTYGIELQGGEQEQDQTDPQILGLRQELNETRNQLNQFLTQAQQTSVQSFNAQIQSFRDEKDEAGNPKHPHFDSVYDSMVQIVKGGLAKTLPDAYEKAVRLQPELTAQQSEQADKARKEKERLEKAEKAKKAKKAASGIKSASANVKSAAPKTIFDEIREAVDAAAG